MYKATLQFQLPSQSSEFDAARTGVAIHACFEELSHYLAALRSYGGNQKIVDQIIDQATLILNRYGQYELADGFGVAPETGMGEPE